MTHNNSAGKQAVRLAIFRAHVDPIEAVAATQYVGPNNYFSLVWTSQTEACLYVHDEFTPGGHLIACTNMAQPPEITGFRYEACTLFIDVLTTEGLVVHELPVPELCQRVEDFQLNAATETVCIIMSDETQHCVDLAPVLANYVYNVVEDPNGRFTFTRAGQPVISWWEGGFSVAAPDGTVTITNPDGTTVTIPAPLEAQDIEVAHTGDGYVTLLVDGDEIGRWQQGDYVGEGPEDGQYFARKSDGTFVRWKPTLASWKEPGRIVRIDNANNSFIEFDVGTVYMDQNDFGGDGSPDNRYTINWSRLCSVSTTVETTVPDHRVLMCRNGALEKISPDDLIGEFCFNDVPDLGEVCAVGEQLVLVPTTDGCQKLARVTQASYQRTTIGLYTVWGHQPANASGLSLINDAPVPGLYYNSIDHTSDGGLDTVPYNGGQYGNGFRAAPGLDGAKIGNMRIGYWSGINQCQRVFDGRVVLNPVIAPLVQDAYDQVGVIGRRVRYREAGIWTPWLYRFAAGTGGLLVSSSFNGIEREIVIDTNFPLYPGEFELEYYYIAGTTPLDIRANTFVPGFAPQSPRVEISARVA